MKPWLVLILVILFTAGYALGAGVVKGWWQYDGTRLIPLYNGINLTVWDINATAFCYHNGTCLTQPVSNGSSLWSANGSKIYYNNGNVGIGTNDPDDPLHVIGTVRIERVGNPTNYFEAFHNGNMNFDTNFLFNFQANTNTILRYTPSEVRSYQPLFVEDNIEAEGYVDAEYGAWGENISIVNSSPHLYTGLSGGKGRIYAYDTGYVDINIGEWTGSPQLHLDVSTGYVGIQTNSPGYELHVNGDMRVEDEVRFDDEINGTMHTIVLANIEKMTNDAWLGIDTKSCKNVGAVMPCDGSIKAVSIGFTVTSYTSAGTCGYTVERNGGTQISDNSLISVSSATIYKAHNSWARGTYTFSADDSYCIKYDKNSGIYTVDPLFATLTVICDEI